MNSRTILSLMAAAVLVAFNTSAQDSTTKFALKFRANCRTTTLTGRLVTTTVTEKTVIRDCVSKAGLGTTNLAQYALIYEVGADYNGDIIKVVRRSDGGTICEPFRVLFQKSITDGSGPRDERIGFIFNGQNTDPMGSVIVVQKPRVLSDNTLGPDMITGRFQMLDEVYFPDRKGIMTGYFATGRTVSWD